MYQDFKKFILRGNTVDLAVAVVIGAAFSAIVTGFVTDLIQPLINGITGGKGASVQGVAHFNVISHHFIFPWGDLVSKIISFLIVAAVIFFFVVQPINRLTTIANRNKTTPEPSTKKCPECLSEVPKPATRCAFCAIRLTPSA
jgi:large conductance mechanosensitive channel